MQAYVERRGNSLAIGNDAIEGLLDLAAGSHLAALVNKFTGRSFVLQDRSDCALRFAAPAHRIDIPQWSFRLGSAEAVPHDEDEGYRHGLYGVEVDSRAWPTVAGINEFSPVGAIGYTTVVYPGYGWYRQSFILPEEARGEAISLVLGGCDNQDWLDYWVYVNGMLAGHAAPGTERWHPAPRYILRPGNDLYSVLRFGAANALAVQARGLDRRSPRMVPSDLERYSVQTPLFDQFVAVGEPYHDVSAFYLVSQRQTERADRAAVDLVLTDGDGTTLEVRYWVTAGEPVLYKSVGVRNTGVRSRILLEMDVHRLAGDAAVSDGGWGEVCVLGDEVFCGLEHPAGIAQGQRGEILLRLLPGRTLQPGASYESKVAVMGAGPAGDGQQSFVRYLERHGRRRREPLSLYSPYGIYDYAGSDPSEVTEPLLLDNLDRLQTLRERGITFDYYAIDTGWNNPRGDLTDFDPQRFPHGPAKILERVRELGMQTGLWVSPSYGPAAFRIGISIPELEPCIVTPPNPEPEGEELGSRPEGAALCLASEPYCSLVRAALLHHVRDNGVRLFKLDGLVLLCNNPRHGHRPGTYAVEAIADALIDTLAQVHDAAADTMIVWYWGARSPWWLLHGATLYEHGIHMEAATPADTPGVLLRQSVTISLDQGTDYAWDRVPLPALDSLGIWLSDTRWGNWMKSEGWQDAWVMDLARGSMLAQLWGDITLFDSGDVDFLERMSAWLRDHAALLRQTRRILASPWSGDPYGYAHFDGAQGMLAVHNPAFAARYVTLRLGDEAGPLPADGALRYGVRCLHPHGHQPVLYNQDNLAVGDTLTLALAPFQVVMLQVEPAAPGAPPVFPGTMTHTEQSRRLPLALTAMARQKLAWDDVDGLDPATLWLIRRAINGRAQYVDTAQSFEQSRRHSDPRDRQLEARRLVGHLELPPLTRGARLVVVARLARDGVSWHHHALFDIITLRATRNGQAMPMTTAPRRWHEQAGGWSWITFQARLEPRGEPVRLDLDVHLCLPATVDTRVEAWLLAEEN